jgi:holo-[acyl-carrier protein] synthase
MIKGIGTDILKISKINEAYTVSSDSFIKKTYTGREIEEAKKCPEPHVYYATRFAAKEAVFKALCMTGKNAAFNEIEILNKESGQPYVRLYGNMFKHAAESEIADVKISISYDDNFAIAFAIAQTRDD